MHWTQMAGIGIIVAAYVAGWIRAIFKRDWLKNDWVMFHVAMTLAALIVVVLLSAAGRFAQ